MTSMNLPTQEDQLNWVIKGIKYAIYKRISPGITHDLVGPLSVALIQAGIIKRKLKADTHQASELLENAINLENYIKQTVLMIRAMKSWDSPNTPIFDVQNVYRQCIKFFQTRLAMRGIDLIVIESVHENTIMYNFQAFLYSWLGLLCYLEDMVKTPKDLHIQQLENNTISIWLKDKQIIENPVGEISTRIENQSEESIGSQELSILSQHYSTTFEFNESGILFRW